MSRQDLQLGKLAILSKNEFDEIKREAMVVTKEEVRKNSKYQELLKQQEADREHMRRQAMKQLYNEKHKDMHQLNEFEQEEADNRNRMREIAKKVEIDNLDEIKLMNQMVVLR